MTTPRGLTRAAMVALGVVLALVTTAVVERLAFRGDVLPGVDVAQASLASDGERDALAELERTARRVEARTVRARGGAVELSL
ncbi:MAG: hypothetical protein ACRDZ1_12725, partial [Acidimicrobiia bacterium]